MEDDQLGLHTTLRSGSAEDPMPNTPRYATQPGQHISEAAREAIALAGRMQRSVRFKFNGVSLVVGGDDEPGAVVARFEAEMEAQHKAWKASLPGQAVEAERRSEIDRLQSTADDLAGRVDTLDFSDQGAVLDFLAALQPCSDRGGVTVQNAEIVAAFAAAGLTPNMDLHSPHLGVDRNVYFRWLVGQALDGLTSGPAIHGAFHKFADEWRAKWPSAAIAKASGGAE